MRERGEAAGPRIVVLDDDPSGGQRANGRLVPARSALAARPPEDAPWPRRSEVSEAASSAGTTAAIPAFGAIGAASNTPASNRPSNLRAAIFPGTVVGPQALVEASGAAG